MRHHALQSRVQRYVMQVVAQEVVVACALRSVHHVPRQARVVMHVTSGAWVQQRTGLVAALASLALLSGQVPVVRPAKRALASFRQRVGMPLGGMVNLRGQAAWHGVDHLATVVLPSMRGWTPTTRSNGSPTSRGRSAQWAFGVTSGRAWPNLSSSPAGEALPGLDITMLLPGVPSTTGVDAMLYTLRRVGMPLVAR